MRLVATRRVAVGALLARDVPSGHSPVPLLRAGTHLTARYRDALLREGIHAVYVDDALGVGIEVPTALSEETRIEATRVVHRAFADVSTSGATGVPLGDTTINELRLLAERIAHDVADCGDAAVALADLAAADAYTMQHSIDVAVLGLLIGRRLFRDHGRVDYRGERTWSKLEERLAKLGMGLLLHDVGKLAIPREIVVKPGALTDEEWQIMRTHPVAGFELLKSDLVPATVKAVVRSHHERWDGSGYPDGRAGDRIHQLARIAAVADVYDAVTSERPYRRAEAPWVGHTVIRDGSGTAFDSQVCDIFARVVAPYPPGSEVKLADGRRGIVAEVPSERPDRPLLRIAWDPSGRRIRPYELALADQDGLEIVGAPAPALAA